MFFADHQCSRNRDLLWLLQHPVGQCQRGGPILRSHHRHHHLQRRAEVFLLVRVPSGVSHQQHPGGRVSSKSVVQKHTSGRGEHDHSPFFFFNIPAGRPPPSLWRTTMGASSAPWAWLCTRCHLFSQPASCAWSHFVCMSWLWLRPSLPPPGYQLHHPSHHAAAGRRAEDGHLRAGGRIQPDIPVRTNNDICNLSPSIHLIIKEI